MLKVKQTNHSSNLTMRSREVQLSATHQDDPGCLTHVWPMFDPYDYLRSNPPPPTSTTLYILARNINILFLQNIFIDAAILYLKTGRIIKFSLILQNYLHEWRYDFHIFTGNTSILSMQNIHTASWMLRCCIPDKRIIKFSLVLQNYLHEERHNFHIFTGNISILSLQSMPTASWMLRCCISSRKNY